MNNLTNILIVFFITLCLGFLTGYTYAFNFKSVRITGSHTDRANRACKQETGAYSGNIYLNKWAEVTCKNGTKVWMVIH